jgi:hypothetical protein
MLLLASVVLAATLLLFIAHYAALWLLVATSWRLLGSFVALLVVTLCLLLPLAMEIAVAAAIPQQPGWFRDLPLFVLLLPVAVSTALAAKLTLGPMPLVVKRYWAAIMWSGAVGVLNTVNACNPGWCARYGFPFAFYEWSDGLIMMNGEWPEPFRMAALGANFLIFAIGGAFLIRACARTHLLKAAA